MKLVITLVAVLSALPILSIAQTDTTLHTPMYTVKTDKVNYAVGTPVKITFIIDNRSTEPLVYRFPTGQQYDMWASKNGNDIWRWSRGRMFIQAFTTLTIPARGKKVFTETWNQTDVDGKPVPEGHYNISAQIKGQGSTLAKTTISIGAGQQIGALCLATESSVCLATKISSVTDKAANYLGKTVTLQGKYRGWRPNSNSPACKQGPPVTRSDWAIKDATGCIYVHGKTYLDPVGDIGKEIIVTGIVKKTAKGQPYIWLTEIMGGG